MSPKSVASDSQANGQHMHLSLQPASPPLEASFLAGILKRLPSLCSFCLPLEMSYERLKRYEIAQMKDIDSQAIRELLIELF
ncbi:glutamine synthetase [Penicillium cf. griseofulvum]|nr:glutamine synthetase [Penicillium cf. griseofulvum]